MKRLVLFLGLFCFVGLVSGAISFDSGYWETTFDCANWVHDYPSTLNCDGLVSGGNNCAGTPDDIPCSETDQHRGEAIQGWANNPDGNGGGAQVHYFYTNPDGSPATNDVSGGLPAVFPENLQEVWFRFYVYYSSEISLNTGWKIVYPMTEAGGLWLSQPNYQWFIGLYAPAGDGYARPDIQEEGWLDTNDRQGYETWIPIEVYMKNDGDNGIVRVWRYDELILDVTDFNLGLGYISGLHFGSNGNGIYGPGTNPLGEVVSIYLDDIAIATTDYDGFILDSQGNFRIGLLNSASSVCGDDSCDGTESCGSCPGDCGECSVCGNGVIETGESCDDFNTVTEDCSYGLQSCVVCSSGCLNVSGATSYCGDGICDSLNEDSAGCSGDCGEVVLAAGVIIEDTYLSNNDVNYDLEYTLNTYTWPVDTSANSILIKLDLSRIENLSEVGEVLLGLYLTEAGGDSSYEIGVHRVVGVDPVLSLATGNTYDGVNAWSSSLGLGDVFVSEDVLAVDNNLGYKYWNVTEMVAYWIANPSENYGLLLSSDTVASVDSFRFFGSLENADEGVWPELVVSYVDAEDVVCGDCHEADLDEDGEVSLGELQGYIGRWLAGEVSIGDVISAVSVFVS